MIQTTAQNLKAEIEAFKRACRPSGKGRPVSCGVRTFQVGAHTVAVSVGETCLGGGRWGMSVQLTLNGERASLAAAVAAVAAQPEAAEPVAAEPETVQPVVAEPEAAEPEAAQPEAVQPVVAEPVAYPFGLGNIDAADQLFSHYCARSVDAAELGQVAALVWDRLMPDQRAMVHAHALKYPGPLAADYLVNTLLRR